MIRHEQIQGLHVRRLLVWAKNCNNVSSLIYEADFQESPLSNAENSPFNNFHKVRPVGDFQTYEFPYEFHNSAEMLKSSNLETGLSNLSFELAKSLSSFQVFQ